jgi:hypothetical protein
MALNQNVPHFMENVAEEHDSFLMVAGGGGASHFLSKWKTFHITLYAMFISEEWYH